MKLVFTLFLAGTLALSTILLSVAEPTVPQSAAESSKGPASSPSETVGDWSEIVDHMKGRLVIETGIDAAGATEVGIFVELQNLRTDAFGRRIVTFARDRSLQWAMTDAQGKAVPEWSGDLPWTIDYNYAAESVTILAEGRVRFKIGSGNYHYLREGVFGTGDRALTFFQGPGAPLWDLANGDGEPYSLRATFKGMKQSQSDFDFLWSGPLSLPPVTLPAKPKAATQLFPARR